MKPLGVTLGAVCVLLLGTSQAYAAPIIYIQPTNSPSGNVYASQNDTSGGNGHFATMYDNFALGVNSLVTDVEWTGGFFNGGHGAISAFTIGFWSNNVNQPGAALLTQTISGNANETFLDSEFFGPVYTYSLNLTSPFLASAGTQYWLSIVPDMGVPPQWG